MNLYLISLSSDRRKFSMGVGVGDSSFYFLSAISRPCPGFSDWSILWVWPPLNLYFLKSFSGDSVVQLFVETRDASPTSFLWRCWIWGFFILGQKREGRESKLPDFSFFCFFCFFCSSLGGLLMKSLLFLVKVNAEWEEWGEGWVHNPIPQMEGRLIDTRES